MKKHVLAIAICVFAFAAAAFATVTVTSPANNSTQSSAVKFVATSTSNRVLKGSLRWAFTHPRTSSSTR